jgi:tetratricopeptide (TPR) repeat protein
MTVLVLSAALLAGAEQSRPPRPAPSFETLAAQAEQAREANRPEAAALYQKALKIKPSWRDGWWALGSLQYQRERYTDCRDSFQKVSAIEPKAAASWTMLGLCEAGAKQYEPALGHLLEGQRLGVPVEAIDWTAKFYIARLYTRSSGFEQAVALLFQAAQAGKEGSKWIMQAGTAALWKPVFPEDVPESDRELVFLAGKAFWDAAAKRGAEARRSFATLIEKYPSAPGVHYLYGGFELSENPDVAIAEFQKELTIQPGHPGALAALAAEYLRQGEPSKAIPFAREAVEKSPNAVAPHALLGRSLAETGELENGIKELERARDLGPDEPQTRIALASVYAKAGRRDEAARERREFVRLKGSATEAAEERK